MTEKQEKILKAAQQLFATEGYHATATSKVAKLAGVSEGLIFRHFGNKEGLLKAITDLGAEKAKKLFAEVIFENDPKKAIEKMLEIPFSIKSDEFDFWKLQYKLKWELKNFDDEKIEPLMLALTSAFEKLEYPFPAYEAEFMIMNLDGTATAILKGNMRNEEEMLKFQKSKYDI